MEKTTTGLSENVAGLLCYVGIWISGLIFILLEQKNKFVRFHAMQSIIVFGVLTLARIILGWIPIVGTPIGWVIFTIGFILWVVLMIRAYQGVMVKVPWAGNLAEKWVTAESQ